MTNDSSLTRGKFLKSMFCFAGFVCSTNGVNLIITIVYYSDEEFGNTSFTGPTGVITSPKFPLTYPHGLNCVYSIEVDRTKTISFDFLSFELEGSIYSSMTEICNHDWLTVSGSL